jgi:hypothetical protein
VGTGDHFPGIKQPGREADHSPPSSAEVKKEWSYTSTAPFVFMAYCLISTSDNLTFYLPAAPKIFIFPSDESGGFREMDSFKDLIVLQELHFSGS